MDLLSLRVAASVLKSRGTPSLRLANMTAAAQTLVNAGLVEAGALRDVSKLRYQAVFMMGAGGSGKGFVGQRWMNYMPGGDGIPPEVLKEKMKEKLTEEERGLTNLNFQKVMDAVERFGITIELEEGGKASIPFRLYNYGPTGRKEVLPEAWASELPAEVFRAVEGLKKVVFTTPVHELPSYWRQVNPDLYKEELAGYIESNPGYVHDMSADMSRAYFEATIRTGDPMFVDGTGSVPAKMKEQMDKARDAGYRVSLVYVLVPLTVNQIRNAIRPRNVNPSIITTAWKTIDNSFHEIKSIADRAKVVINRNDSADEAAYLKNKEKVDTFIRAKTGEENLYEYIKKVAPQDLADWGEILKGKESPKNKWETRK